MISIIVAVDEQGAIGYENKLLCYLPNDLKHFKEITIGHAIIMGRKTYESLPKRPLPHRKNIVLTTGDKTSDDGAVRVDSWEKALDEAGENAFVIGGASLYKQTLDKVERIYLTRIHYVFEEADAFFPSLDLLQWKLIEKSDFASDEKHRYAYTFETYVRR